MGTGTRVICFANNKEGVGSQRHVPMWGTLWQAGRRVLLIDGDMQMTFPLSF